MHIGYHEFTRMVPYMRKKHPVGVIRASCRSLQGPPWRAEGKGVTERAPGSRSSQSQGPCKPLYEEEGIPPYLKSLLNPPFVKGGLEITRTRYSYLPLRRGGDSHEMQGLRD